ncbi:uncharacterized protein IL334_007856 [Kwoniella shivajii]|uniref:SAP domain-containing protein n=1 Tax=Kwoniella shivajii TaxID=564305 RepID=A0ABZ1DDR1_9TREE|nr:hypothetical protein IL334_007856 [Kwoniella shivajii]
MLFSTPLALLSALTVTQAAPLLGSLFHPNSTTSHSVSPSATYSAHFPAYTGSFNLTEVLEEHHVDISDLKSLNVTQLLAELGITLPSGINLDSIISDLEKHSTNFTGGSFFHTNGSHTSSFVKSSSSAKPTHTGGFLGGLFGHHGHNHTSSAVSSTSASPSSTFTSSSESSLTPTPSISVSFAIPSASASASISSASSSDIFSIETSSFPSASAAPSARESSSEVITSAISTVTDDDVGLAAPTLISISLGIDNDN